MSDLGNLTPVARLQGVSLCYGKKQVLDNISLDLPSGCMVGLLGPDGVGKSSLFALLSGSRKIQSGWIEVLGGDMADRNHRYLVCPRVAYMPQGLGGNLYPTLSVFENVDFFARLFGHNRIERQRRIDDLLLATGLRAFSNRPAGKLSGGMKQKLGLCCALIHDPELLILDEPTTGVDPLSRRQFWELIDRIRSKQQDMSVLVATAYMDEAAGFDWLVAMNDGTVLATGTPMQFLEQTKTNTLEDAFIQLLPEEQRKGYIPVTILPRETSVTGERAIEAHNLTIRFGDFTAVDHVSFQIDRGEIFGFLGSNGCGKTTTMKMLTGLLPASEGDAWLFGRPVTPDDLDTRRRVGFMTQFFSLYSELTVHQNLVLHARLFKIERQDIPQRVQEMALRFGLTEVMDSLPASLPLGVKQRLSLAVAMIHGPEMLILDEPTSGVDPIARNDFWRIMIELSRKDKVTIFISTHFMNEAERCDRISLMHAGKVLISDTPDALVEKCTGSTLEEAFIEHLEGEADASESEPEETSAWTTAPGESVREKQATDKRGKRIGLNLRRLSSYARRESLELLRDPIRLTLALLGSAILLFVMGYGISLDVENLRFAVLDRDQTSLSRDYVYNIAGSRYFSKRPPISAYAELDHRMRTGEISLAIELPPGFARQIHRGKTVDIGVWADGAMPTRAETVLGYIQGIHAGWLASLARQSSSNMAQRGQVSIETRYRYNPDVKSLPAMVPAVIPLLLMMIPAMLTALSVVREKELGSIVNFYVTPVSRLEFLLGKQLPYVILAMCSFLLLVSMAVFLFGIPLKGSFPALTLAALLYSLNATALGLVISTFMRSQIAALFGTALLTLLPAIQYSGMIDPISSLDGTAAFIGQIYPTTHFLTIARGAFSKALGFSDLWSSFILLFIAVPVLIGLGGLLLRKQER